MKKITTLTTRSTLLIAPLILAGCATFGGSEADARWASYEDWTQLNNLPITGDHTGFIGNLHRGPSGYRNVFVNDIGIETSLGGAPYSYPIGSVVVKEQYKNESAYTSDSKPDLTIMVKVSDDALNPGENWAWSRGLNKEANTDDVFCSGCHTIAFQNDFVFSNADSLSDFR